MGSVEKADGEWQRVLDHHVVSVRLFTEGGEGPRFDWPPGLVEEFRAAWSKCLALGPDLFLYTVIRRMKPELLQKAAEIDSWRMFRDAYKREVVRMIRPKNDGVIVQVLKKR